MQNNRGCCLIYLQTYFCQSFAFERQHAGYCIDWHTHFMKKQIILGAAFALALASCSRNDQWIDGRSNGRFRDTTFYGSHYRWYNNYWYPVYMNRISPYGYQGSTYEQISRPSYTPTRTSNYSSPESSVRSGGFGSSSHSSAGE